MHPYVHNNAIHNSQDVGTTQMSTYRWMDKDDVVHNIQWKIVSHKKEQNNAICSHMDATGNVAKNKIKKKTDFTEI